MGGHEQYVVDRDRFSVQRPGERSRPVFRRAQHHDIHAQRIARRRHRPNPARPGSRTTAASAAASHDACTSNGCRAAAADATGAEPSTGAESAWTAACSTGAANAAGTADQSAGADSSAAAATAASAATAGAATGAE